MGAAWSSNREPLPPSEKLKLASDHSMYLGATPAPMPMPAKASGRTRWGKDTRHRIAILGGSFDPITDGHLKCACEIVHARVADEVWIVPCGRRPDKPSLKTPYMHRLIMCHLAVNTSFGSQFPIRVCDIEAAEESALSTYHLMLKLQQTYPEPRFMFVLGADLIESIKTWPAPNVPNAGELLYNNFDFVVLERPGFTIPNSLPPNFTKLVPPVGSKIVTEDVSSSLIRNRIQNYGESERSELQHGHFQAVDGLLTPAVLAHIIRYRLYSP